MAAHQATHPYPYAWFKGELTPIGEANVSIMTNALQYGTAFFGGLRSYYDAGGGTSNIFRLPEHCRRFMQSARIMGCQLDCTAERLADLIRELATKNQLHGDTYIRPFAYASHLGIGPTLAKAPFELAIYMIPLGDYLPTDTGLKVMVSSWRRTSDNAIPSLAKAAGGYINSALAAKEAADNGYDEAIMLHEGGLVSEGSCENIFLVRDGRLITPAVGDNILEGITRRSLLKIASDLGIPTEVRPVERSELYVADEMFLSGTGCQVAWVASVDRRPVGDGRRGPITKQLQDTFFSVVRGQEQTYADWRTVIQTGQPADVQ